MNLTSKFFNACIIFVEQTNHEFILFDYLILAYIHSIDLILCSRFSRGQETIMADESLNCSKAR